MLIEGQRPGDFVAHFHQGALAAAVLLFLAPWPTNGQPLPGAEPQEKAGPVESAPAPPTTPKPMTGVETWFAQVDGPQQEAFQKQVVKPFEAGLADLRARYLSAVDAAIAKASAASHLDEALAIRTERQAFAQAQNVAADDRGVPPGVQALRASFRQQLVKLEQARLAKAKALLAEYDAILEKNQALLTQHQRLDDAVLLKTKRDEIAGAWLAPSPLIAPGAAPSPESAKSVNAPPAAKGADIQPAATKENPFVNTLGMKFVPVPINRGPTSGHRVLFSIWDIRVQDYQVFAEETKRDWPKPGFKQGPTHPAVNVIWDDAKAFCAWLTERERKAGKLVANEEYRLPNDHEWSTAVGLPPEQGAMPADRSGKNPVEFPWGQSFPPTSMNVGNYRDEAWHQKFPDARLWLKGYTDGYVNTAPVGSFAANRFGLFDMGGNVWQWCEDWYDNSQKDRVVRGGSWDNHDHGSLLSSHRTRHPPADRDPSYGFRCVLEASAR